MSSSSKEGGGEVKEEEKQAAQHLLLRSLFYEEFQLLVMRHFFPHDDDDSNDDDDDGLKNTKTIINSSYGKSIIRGMAFAAKGGASRSITNSFTSSKRSTNFVRLAATNNNHRFAMMTMMSSSSSRGQKTTTAAVGKGMPVPVPDNEELPFSRSAHNPWGENDERFLGNDEDKRGGGFGANPFDWCSGTRDTSLERNGYSEIS